jgi:excisionase family DNA binding protein
MADLSAAALSPIALTIPEAAIVSKLSRSELYRAMSRGDLQAKKNGRLTLILRDDLQRFLTGLPAYRAVA